MRPLDAPTEGSCCNRRPELNGIEQRSPVSAWFQSQAAPTSNARTQTINIDSRFARSATQVEQRNNVPARLHWRSLLSSRDTCAGQPGCCGPQLLGSPSSCAGRKQPASQPALLAKSLVAPFPAQSPACRAKSKPNLAPKGRSSRRQTLADADTCQVQARAQLAWTDLDWRSRVGCPAGRPFATRGPWDWNVRLGSPVGNKASSCFASSSWRQVCVSAKSGC